MIPKLLTNEFINALLAEVSIQGDMKLEASTPVDNSIQTE